MPRIQFSKWDPSGNTTLFFPSGTQGNHADLAHEALLAQKLGGEQAGFVDTDAQSLVMAGGEFCVNATRCLGALLDLTAQRSGGGAAASSPRTYTVRVSGWPDSTVSSTWGSCCFKLVTMAVSMASSPALEKP